MEKVRGKLKYWGRFKSHLHSRFMQWCTHVTRNFIELNMCVICSTLPLQCICHAVWNCSCMDKILLSWTLLFSPAIVEMIKSLPACFYFFQLFKTIILHWVYRVQFDTSYFICIANYFLVTNVQDLNPYKYIILSLFNINTAPL